MGLEWVRNGRVDKMESAAFLRQHHLPSFSFFSSKIKLKTNSIRNNTLSCSNNKLLSICSALRNSERQQQSLTKEEAVNRNTGNSATIVSSCVVGVLTGIAIVVFNGAVHEIRDVFWDGIPSRGASWLREEPLDSIWTRVILVPACGGFIVSVLNAIRRRFGDSGFEAAVLKAVAACFTLGTGNSLGPEGPSVEIGSSIAKGVASLVPDSQVKLSLLAAGSAAGIASGFNAAVAGCFFAVESVLWPSSADSSVSVTNTTSMVILSAVIASVVSEVGLGSQPAFKVPEYDFRSIGVLIFIDVNIQDFIRKIRYFAPKPIHLISELPLYLLLGILCGLVSLALSRCTSFLLLTVNNLHRDIGIPTAAFPVLGGLAVGTMALVYPEILYWGFQNVDILLESQPFVEGLSADLLLQLVGVKIVATSLCRASGLVGGYYAPSLFIGAATGMAYGKLISFAVAQSSPIVHLSILEVASPQAYGLVGMAATLAGVCQVPLTAVLLLFELTQDYRIVIPLLGAVGFSSWITSGQTRRKDVEETKKVNEENALSTQHSDVSSSIIRGPSSGFLLAEIAPYATNLCEVESSLCIGDSIIQNEVLKKRIFVSEAMRTRYVTVSMSTLVTEAVGLMLVEKQSCALIVDDNNIVVGLLTLVDIESLTKIAKAKAEGPKDLLVSEICSMDGEKCRIPLTAKPSMDLFSVQIIMDRYGVSHIPVISEHVEDHNGYLVGLLDTECIDLTCRVLATKESLT